MGDTRLTSELQCPSIPIEGAIAKLSLKKGDLPLYSPEKELADMAVWQNQESARIRRLQKMFEGIHDAFKSLESATDFLSRTSNADIDLTRWELISLAYTVELCVLYERSFLKRGRELVKKSPQILTRLQQEPGSNENLQQQIILLPPHAIDSHTGRWEWLESPPTPPQILVFPCTLVSQNSDLVMLSEQGEVFAELWKVFKSQEDLCERLERLHALLEALTLPPPSFCLSTTAKSEVLTRIITICNGFVEGGLFERKMTDNLLSAESFNVDSGTWLISLVAWKCVWDVHGERMRDERSLAAVLLK
ncbi:hypothetical protein HDU82_004118 [Entophlyctis luteolus]|nr:hypothetical protein HDU82_004118 [Entophlyctis luteolus]KAJ3381757.1 hypothetical protein HDU84_004865 [Entophlyctis sp. JEL0112]